MTKEHYLQVKKQARVWFTVNIVISLMAIAGGILVVISKSRHIPFLLMALGALTLMNQVLVELSTEGNFRYIYRTLRTCGTNNF